MTHLQEAIKAEDQTIFELELAHVKATEARLWREYLASWDRTDASEVALRQCPHNSLLQEWAASCRAEELELSASWRRLHGLMTSLEG